MKTNFLKQVLVNALLTGLFVFVNINNVNSQSNPKPLLTVFNIDSKGIGMTPDQLGNLVRIEVEKLDRFQVMDRYDVNYMVEKNSLTIANCYGKICMVEVGKALGADKVMSGSVELYGETIILTIRIVDVNQQIIEKAQVVEFLNLQKEMQSMVNITLGELFGLEIDKDMKERLTKRYNFENLTTNPDKDRLSLDGPRMGSTFYTGQSFDIIQAPKSEGGYDAFPVMFQFGYQFEKQYLNEGNFQALFEFIPMITGLDQGFFIPSFAILNGLRSNKNGWEFAFGPTFYLAQNAKGYYDTNDGNKWKLAKDLNPEISHNHKIITRMDSRGDMSFGSGFVFACGRTFKSGKLNIPVNMFFIPNKDGFRAGLSFGFNAKNVVK